MVVLEYCFSICTATCLKHTVKKVCHVGLLVKKLVEYSIKSGPK